MSSKISDLTEAQPASGYWIRGFTLAELMVALAVASIVLAVITGVYAGLMRSYTTQNAVAEVQQTVRAGIDYMAEDIMMAGFNPRNGSGDSRIDQTEAGNTQPYIDNVTNLTFTYRDADGQDLINDLGKPDPITALADRADIRTVEISITVQEPAGRDKTVDRTYTTRVWCRNVSL
jgi:type IV pilus assembly protein PilW